MYRILTVEKKKKVSRRAIHKKRVLSFSLSLFFYLVASIAGNSSSRCSHLFAPMPNLHFSSQSCSHAHSSTGMMLTSTSEETLLVPWYVCITLVTFPFLLLPYHMIWYDAIHTRVSQCYTSWRQDGILLLVEVDVCACIFSHKQSMTWDVSDGVVEHVCETHTAAGIQTRSKSITSLSQQWFMRA